MGVLEDNVVGSCREVTTGGQLISEEDRGRTSFANGEEAGAIRVGAIRKVGSLSKCCSTQLCGCESVSSGTSREVSQSDLNLVGSAHEVGNQLGTNTSIIIIQSDDVCAGSIDGFECDDTSCCT